MDATGLYDLLASTQIEDFDAVEEAFKLLDVDNKGHLTVDTFKMIFKNLELGEIASSDEDIFREVADFDHDGVINLSDFRQILTYKPGEDKD
jgi:Ca2+-binding EF-hand superfamily protein